MFTVIKSFKVPIGHRLSLHKGRCQNIHGHNLKFEIEISRKKLNDNDMVIDFYDLKRITNEVLDKWDHSLFLNINDKIWLENHDVIEKQRIIHMEYGDPTSENFCVSLYELLFEKFSDFDNELLLKSVAIWESDESYAKYEPKVITMKI